MVVTPPVFELQYTEANSDLATPPPPRVPTGQWAD